MGHQPAAALPGLRRRVSQAESQYHREDRAAWLGRLLERHPDRHGRRHRARRLHQPPGQVPRVRQQEPAGRHPAAGREGQGRHQPVHSGPGRPVGARRQALRPAEGLGYGRDRLQYRHAEEGRRRPGVAEGSDLECAGRRHLRRADRQADARLQRQERPRPGLRQDQGCPVRLRPAGRGRLLRPDAVEHVRRQQRLQVYRRPLDQQILLRRPQAGRDNPVVRRPGPGQGLRPAAGRLHHQRRRHVLPGGQGRADHRWLVDDRRLREELQVQARLCAAAEGAGGPQVDVQRPGRLDLGGLEAPGGGLAVGQVRRLARVRGHRRQGRRGVPGDQERCRRICGEASGGWARRDRLHRPGARPQGHVPVPDHRPRR